MFLRSRLRSPHQSPHSLPSQLDPKISTLISKEIEKESIVVFDEAHNIDNICIEALSITLDKPTIFAAARNLNKLQKLIAQAEASNSQRLQDEYKMLVRGLLQSGTLSRSVAEQVGLVTGPAASAAAGSAAAAAAGGSGSVAAAADELLGSPVLPDDIKQQAVPGTIRKARNFVQFLKVRRGAP